MATKRDLAIRALITQYEARALGSREYAARSGWNVASIQYHNACADTYEAVAIGLQAILDGGTDG